MCPSAFDFCLATSAIRSWHALSRFGPPSHARGCIQFIHRSRKYCCLDICPGADIEGIVLGPTQASELVAVHGSCKVCFMCLRIGVQDLAFSWNTRQIRGAYVPRGAGVDASLSNFSPLFIYLFWFPCFVSFLPATWFPGQTLRLPCSVRGAPGAFLSPIVLIIQNTVFNLQTFKVKLGTAVTLEGDSAGSNNQNTVIEAVM